MGNVYDNITDVELDALREIGNIGSGNAATSLSAMLGIPINIRVPTIKILDYQAVVDTLGGPEKMIMGVLLSLNGEVKGMMMFLQEQQFVHMTLNNLLQTAYESFTEVDEMATSALQEVSNIMASAYVNAVGIMSQLNIFTSVPSLTVDMLGAILSVPSIYYADISDKIIFIENSFVNNGVDSKCHILMIPDNESLQKILINLGLEG